MSIFGWCSRRAPGISILLLLALSYWVLSSEVAPKAADVSEHSTLHYGKKAYSSKSADPSTSNAGNWTILWAYYSLYMHVITVIFPLRACWAIDELKRSLKKLARSKQLKEFKYPPKRRLSSTSLSSADTLTSSQSSSTSEAGDVELGLYTDGDVDQDRVIHAIIIPNYKEDVDGLRETLDVLSSHPQARSQYDIYLAMEAREQGAEMKALGLVSEYVKKFRFIDFTLHPSDIPNEAPGKSSNVAWAARKASERYPAAQRKDVIVTGIDADSHLSCNFTTLITNMHLLYPDTASTTLYAAPIIFDRNAHEVPAIVRVADILWCAAGLSGLYSTSSIRPPTSVYSLPMELIDRVGGWDTDAEALGEDLHMYVKCFFALNGNLTSRTVLSPVSQSNVTGSGKGIRGQISGIKARYKQALRHMWGALDTGYALRKGAEMWRDRKITTRTFRPLHSSGIDSGNVYVPEGELDLLEQQKPIENGAFSDVVQSTVGNPDWKRTVMLYQRLIEAHFLPTHMMILILGSAIYSYLSKDKPDVLGIAWTFDVTNYLRVIGFIATAFYLFLYEGYHRVCVSTREAEMEAVGLAESMQGHFSYRSIRANFFDYFLMPLVAPTFGSVPAAHAEFSHFWTLDLVYAVSAKPLRLRQRAKSLVQDVLGA